MKTKFQSIIRLPLLMILLVASGSLFSQTLVEAGELFNQGRAFIAEGNNKAAIDNLMACIDICDQLGEEGVELKNQAVGVIPSLWYGYAKELFDQNKMDESMAAYKNTLKVAKEYNDPETYDKTVGVLAQLFLKAGNDKFRDKDYQGAIDNLSQSLEYDAENTATLLLMAYSYRRLDMTTEMIEYFRKTIAAGDISDKNAPKAAEALMGYYMNTGARLINNKNTADGMKYLDTAATYGESGDLYYYYAVGYNADQKYDDAIVAAEKAIELDPSNKENLAKYNFEIGTAWYGKKDNAKACEAYKKANFGRTALRAEPIIRSLKCN